MIDRRRMMGLGLMGAAGLWLGAARAAEPDLRGLATMTGDVRPIDAAERGRRIDAARALMKAHGLDAVLIEPGASLVYFTGIEWHRSERLTAALIPAEGPVLVVTPFFEEPSVRQTLAIPAEVRVWQEDQSPFALIAGFLRDKRLPARVIGIEESARFFASDGLARATGARLASANPVVRGCRMIKSAAEIALMQKAADITIAALRFAVPRIEAGMAPGDIAALVNAATAKLGGSPEFALVLIGPASALPHGSREPQRVAPGAMVLMDCGCAVEGYQSDISRSLVFGTATAEQRRVWDQVREGQQIALKAAQVGAPAGSVDDAVRRRYTGWGYGPDYRLPGLSHRTGHGIGLDGHEPVNLVRGEATRLAPGMCFSNEPGLYLPGKFGVRLEDCFYMTAAGPRWFSTPPQSLDAPLG